MDIQGGVFPQLYKVREGERARGETRFQGVPPSHLSLLVFAGYALNSGGMQRIG